MIRKSSTIPSLITKQKKNIVYFLPGYQLYLFFAINQFHFYSNDENQDGVTNYDTRILSDRSRMLFITQYLCTEILFFKGMYNYFLMDVSEDHSEDRVPKLVKKKKKKQYLQ
jgi:hypothetical protein